MIKKQSKSATSKVGSSERDKALATRPWIGHEPVAGCSTERDNDEQGSDCSRVVKAKGIEMREKKTKESTTPTPHTMNSGNKMSQ